MAVIVCPECSKKVNDSSMICQNCGYPIKEYVKKIKLENAKKEKELAHQAEILRLTSKIKDIEFVCPPPRLKVCLKCGEPFFTCKDVDRPDFDTPVCKCGFPGVEVDFPQLGNHSHLGHYLYILRHEVIPRNIGDKESKEYQDRVTDLYNQIEKSEQRNKSSGRSDWKIEQIPPDRKDFGVSPEKIRYNQQQTVLENLKKMKDDEIKFRNKLTIVASILTLLTIMCIPIILSFAILFGIPAIILWILIFKDKGIEMLDAKISLAEKDIREYNAIMQSRMEAAKIQPNPIPHIPHCPFCSSTDLTKISALGKAIKIELLGLYGADDLGKTYRCRNCGGKF